MTLTIDIDDETRQRLETEAQVAGKALEEYVAYVLKLGRMMSDSFGRPNLGWARGMVHISDDFDAPLDEFKDYL